MRLHCLIITTIFNWDPTAPNSFMVHCHFGTLQMFIQLVISRDQKRYTEKLFVWIDADANPQTQRPLLKGISFTRSVFGECHAGVIIAKLKDNIVPNPIGLVHCVSSIHKTIIDLKDLYGLLRKRFSWL